MDRAKLKPIDEPEKENKENIIDLSKTGSHRKVYTYGNYIIKTPEEGFDIDKTLKFEKEIPDNLPVIKSIIAMKDLKTNKELLVENRGKLFKEFYDLNKDKIPKEEIMGDLNEFMAKWIKEGVIPYEFEPYDLNKHLLVYTNKEGKRILKMTDVVSVRLYNKQAEESNLKNFPNSYLKRIDIKENELLNLINHDFRNRFAAIQGYLLLLTNQKINDETKKEFIETINNYTDKRLINNKIDRYCDVINSLFPYQKKFVNSYGKSLKEKYEKIDVFLKKISLSFNDSDYEEYLRIYEPFEKILQMIRGLIDELE